MPEMYRYTFQPGRDQWIDCSPFYHVVKDRHVPPLLLYYVAGREHHAAENRRFAHKLAKCGHEATVLAAESKTHLTIELDIGTRGDRVTAEILAFFCQRGAQ